MAKTEQKEIAKILYLQGLDGKEIAKKLKVSEVTVSKWKNSGKWDALKINLLNSKNERLSELYNELAEFNRMIKDKQHYKCADSKEADARRKLVTDISELERKYNVGQTIQIGRDFVSFVKDIDFDFAQKTLEYFDAFITNTINKQKWQSE